VGAGSERPDRFLVIVCRGPECGERKQSRHLHSRLLRLVDELGYSNRVEIGWQSCFGRCKSGPNIMIRKAPTTLTPMFAAAVPFGPGTALYNGMRPEDLRRMLEEHVGKGTPVRELMNRAGVEEPVEPPDPPPATSPGDRR
jgi:(2Fe-2S) ferredoxin